MTDRFFVRICAFIFFCVSIPFVASADQNIDVFNVHIGLEPNGSAIVQEEIVYDFGVGVTGMHGIYRRIPLVSVVPGQLRERTVTLSSISVTDGRGNLRQSEYNGGGNFVELKIGEPGVTVSGRQLYVIHYTLWGAIDDRLPGKDEFYWSVTGNEWKESIGAVRADVVLPIPMNEKKVVATCLVGLPGTTETCSASTTPEEGTGIISAVRFTADRALRSNEGLTVSVAIPKGIYLIAPPLVTKKLAPSVGLYHWWRSDYLGPSLLFPLFLLVILLRLRFASSETYESSETRETNDSRENRENDVESSMSRKELMPLTTLLQSTKTGVSARTIYAGLLYLGILGKISFERRAHGGEAGETALIIDLISSTENLTDPFAFLLHRTISALPQPLTLGTLSTHMTEICARMSGSISLEKNTDADNVRHLLSSPLSYILTGSALIFLSFVLSFGNLAFLLSGIILFAFAYVSLASSRLAKTKICAELLYEGDTPDKDSAFFMVTEELPLVFCLDSTIEWQEKEIVQKNLDTPLSFYLINSTPATLEDFLILSSEEIKYLTEVLT